LLIASQATTTTLLFTDLSGKILWRNDNIEEQKIHIPVQNLAGRTYIIIIMDDRGTATLKLVKAG